MQSVDSDRARFTPSLPIEKSKSEKVTDENLPPQIQIATIEMSGDEVVDVANRINWFHGTNSSILASIPYTDYTMMPTGKLLDHGIAPMSGEIKQGGLTKTGINQSMISVLTVEGMKRCWNYATHISHSFNADQFSINGKYAPEEYFLNGLEKLEMMTPDDDNWDSQLVALYQLKQWDPGAFQEIAAKNKERIQALDEKLTSLHSVRELQVLDAVNFPTEILKRAADGDEDARAEIREKFPFMINEDGKDFASFSESIIETAQEQGYGIIADILEGAKNDCWTNYFHKSNESLCLGILYIKLNADDIHDQLAEVFVEDKEAFKRLQEYDQSDRPNFQVVLEKYVNPKMEGRMRKNALPYQKRLNRFQKLFHDQTPVEYSKSDRQNLSNPYPILVGSTKQKSTSSYTSKEYTVSTARFGRDIDVVVVKDEHVERIQEWLADHQLSEMVKVFTYSKLDAIADELHHRPEQVEQKKSFISNDDFDAFDSALREHVLPIYSASYPDGSERVHHGVMHATRTALFSQVIGAMYQDAGSDIVTTPKGLMLSAAMHDSARQNDGQDLWDSESGEKCRELMDTLGIGNSDLLGYAVANKDEKEPTSLEQKIIHDADCIEIIRCLRDPEDFFCDMLWITKDLDSETVARFVSESKLFIKLTENDEIKSFVQKSTDPLKSLYQILLHVNDHHEKLPFLTRCVYRAARHVSSEEQYLLTPMVTNAIDNILMSI